MQVDIILKTIITKDAKWLLHFLKETHLKTIYFNKMESCSYTPLHINNYDSWLNRILSKSSYYINLYTLISNNNDFLKTLFECETLIKSPNLFAIWYNHPWLLSNTQTDEILSWSKVSREYMKIKKTLSLIIK